MNAGGRENEKHGLYLSYLVVSTQFMLKLKITANRQIKAVGVAGIKYPHAAVTLLH